MSQHDYVLENNNGLAFRSDLNSALQAVVTNNAGDSAPVPTFPLMLWPDTLNRLLKIRNISNTGWITIGDLDVTNLGLQTYDANTMKKNVAQVITAVQTQSPTFASSAAYTWAVNTNPNITLTTTGNLTMNAPTGFVEGSFYFLEIVYGGAHTLTWSSTFKGVFGLPLTSVVATKDCFMFRATTTNLECVGFRANVGA